MSLHIANSPPVWSAKQQVDSYIASKQSTTENTLFFLWIGANDIKPYEGHCNFGQKEDPAFSAKMSSEISSMVGKLIASGAPKIVVPAIYPYHLAPIVEKFLTQNQTLIDELGLCIAAANDAIKASLTQYGEKVLYYDTFNFMVSLYNNPNKFGFDHTAVCCDCG